MAQSRKTIESVWASKGNLPDSAIVATSDGKYPALDGSLITGIAGAGDMSASVYDPNTVAADAFARANHTGTQAASTISDFDTEVSNNTTVAAKADQSTTYTISQVDSMLTFYPLSENTYTKIEVDANIAANFTPEQADEITANTLKTGITTAQAEDIVTNNAKVTNATHTGDVTGDGVLTIADDAVDIPMLSATGTADGTTFLRGDNTWATPAGGGDVATDAIWDAKGDLAGGTGADTAARLAVGTNDQVLTADSTQATGMKWATPAGGGFTAATEAQIAARTSNTVGITPFNLLAALAKPFWRSDLNEGSNYGVTGSATTTVVKNSALWMDSNATATSSLVRGFTYNKDIITGNSPGVAARFNYGKAGAMSFVLRNVSGTTNGQGFVLLSSKGWTSTQLGLLSSDRGMGIRIANTTLYGVVSNATTLDESVGAGFALSTSTSAKDREIIITWDGSGNVEWFIDGSSYATSSGGPTGADNSGRVEASIDNGGDASAQEFYIAPIMVL